MVNIVKSKLVFRQTPQSFLDLINMWKPGTDLIDGFFLFSSLTEITSCRSVAVFQWPPWLEVSTQVIKNFSKIGKVVVGKFLASLYYMYYTQQVVQHSILLICTVREVEKVNISWKKSHSLFAGESPFGERDDSCFQVKTSILFNNNLINGKFFKP